MGGCWKPSRRLTAKSIGRAQAYLRARDVGVSGRSNRHNADLGERLRLRGVSEIFTNDHLRALQEQYLSALLRHNFEALRNLGILNTISNARRNDPCPCGSGKN